MSRSLNWCEYCQEHWDDAHWFYKGDTGGIQFQDQLCEVAWRERPDR